GDRIGTCILDHVLKDTERIGDCRAVEHVIEALKKDNARVARRKIHSVEGGGMKHIHRTRPAFSAVRRVYVTDVVPCRRDISSRTKKHMVDMVLKHDRGCVCVLNRNGIVHRINHSKKVELLRWRRCGRFPTVAARRSEYW